MTAYPVTESLAPDAPVCVVLYKCDNCGAYHLGCCEHRDAHAVVYESAWEGIECFSEWAVLEVLRLRDKGVDAWVRDGEGKERGTIAIWARKAEVAG